ncbi:8602_t:CDS:2, partial [Acaulospora morrowiae]
AVLTKYKNCPKVMLEVIVIAGKPLLIFDATGTSFVSSPPAINQSFFQVSIGITSALIITSASILSISVAVLLENSPTFLPLTQVSYQVNTGPAKYNIVNPNASALPATPPTPEEVH